MKDPQHPWRQRWSCFIGGVALLLAGCAAPSNDLTMVSVDRHRDFKQNFSHAYAAVASTGDFDVMLVHDANSDGIVDTGGVLHPSPVIPRQIVHIRVFWIPQSGAKLDHPVSTNASMRWYVFGDRPDEADNMLEYSGSALVLVSPKGPRAIVTIRGAYLKPVQRRGAMADPLGASSVNGTVTALLNSRLVNDLLVEVKAADRGGAQQAAVN